jgi:drug/metabolite transporter (DMT)-like permease
VKTVQTVKIIGLGLLFSFIGAMGALFLGIVIGIFRGPANESAHATGLSAVVGGLIEATVFNPIFWLGIVLAFGGAFWVVRHSQRA